MKIHAGAVRSVMVLAIPLLLPAEDARERSVAHAPGGAPCTTTATPAPSPAPSLNTPARSAGADEGWWRKVAAQIEREEYHASRNDRGLQAPNRAQNLRTWFRRGGIDVMARQGAAQEWRFTWQTARWGRPGRLETLQPVAVEPEASPLITQTLAGQPLTPAPHKIQGLGANFVPKNLDLAMVDRVERVSNEESIAMARRLAREEGILCGVSCGAAWWMSALRPMTFVSMPQPLISLPISSTSKMSA